MTHALAFLAGLGVATLAVVWWCAWETRRATWRARKRYWSWGG